VSDHFLFADKPVGREKLPNAGRSLQLPFAGALGEQEVFAAAVVGVSARKEADCHQRLCVVDIKDETIATLLAHHRTNRLRRGHSKLSHYVGSPHHYAPMWAFLILLTNAFRTGLAVVSH